MSEKIFAPWTEEQVLQLQEHQNRVGAHPYTCGECGEVLVPSAEGWKCSNCTYTQNWAHDPNQPESGLTSVMNDTAIYSGVF